MAHSKQAKKRIRQNERAAARNRPVRSYAARRVRDAREAIALGDDDATEAFRVAQSALDVAMRKGVLHRNTAARRKARLAKALKAAGAAA